VVNNRHWGIIYQNEIYTDVNVGDRLTGFVKQVRPDGKVDVTLSPIERLRVDSLADRILADMRASGGTLALNDKSSPDDIFAAFACSKKDFKKALGQLYREHKIIQENGKWSVER